MAEVQFGLIGICTGGTRNGAALCSGAMFFWWFRQLHEPVNIGMTFRLSLLVGAVYETLPRAPSVCALLLFVYMVYTRAPSNVDVHLKSLGVDHCCLYRRLSGCPFAHPTAESPRRMCDLFRLRAVGAKQELHGCTWLYLG